MRQTYADFQRLIPNLTWPPAELAEKLSFIGHETEIVEPDNLNIIVNGNRPDCQDLRYLVFDLAGIYAELETIPNLIQFTTDRVIEIDYRFVNKFLGSWLDFQKFAQLNRLGFKVTETHVAVPDFRRDVMTKADVAEEVFRLIGSDGIKTEDLSPTVLETSQPYQNWLDLRARLAKIGLTETTTYSFDQSGNLKLVNSFSQDEPYLRASLLHGLLKTLAKNPYLKRTGFFELGTVFLPVETTQLGIALAGYKDATEMAAKIKTATGLELNFQAVEAEKLNEFEVKQSRAFFAEIDIISYQPIDSLILPTFELKKMQPISKFPPLVRDVTVATGSPYFSNQHFQLAVRHAFDNLLITDQTDQYIGENRQTVTYRLIFQKMAASFTEAEIRDIDTRLNNLFFQS